MAIAPYWQDGTWVFDDDDVGLRAEPFVAGIPEMINDLVSEIPDARQGFRMIFSAQPFPGYQRELIWIREEFGGNWYWDTHLSLEGWLCPAMFRYFSAAPEKKYLIPKFNQHRFALPTDRYLNHLRQYKSLLNNISGVFYLQSLSLFFMQSLSRMSRFNNQ